MLILRGAPALSPFRIKSLVTKLQGRIPEISGIYAEHLYFGELRSPLTTDQNLVLQNILDAKGSYKESLNTDKTNFLVVPRLGTISPWSSKATDIAHSCGLDSVQRLERGTLYFLDTKNPLSTEVLTPIRQLLHDRMTETVLSSLSEAEQLFSQTEPEPLVTIPVLNQGYAAIEAANNKLQLALTSSEMSYLCDLFNNLKRDPTDVELMMFAQANSEHCRHKIFNATWKIDGKEKPLSLFSMIRHTYRCNPGKILSAYKDNAAVIEGNPTQRFAPNPDNCQYEYSDEAAHILLKVETHNHPTAISPFAGAATGVGGEIRDEGATGCGAKPKAGLIGYSVSNLHLPNFEQPWELSSKKPDHIASALEIMIEAPLGGSAFNNEFGRPNLCGYFRTYEQQINGPLGKRNLGYHKPIMLAGGIGNIKAEHVQKQEVPVKAKLIVLGGAAMQIGLGGGAASSIVSSDENPELDFSSVQRGDPEMERRCQEVIDRCWQMAKQNPILFIHDVGAGGLSNALPELVHDSGLGGQFELRDIPIDEPGMSPLAIWANESQERYVLAIEEKNLTLFSQICQRERCPFAVVGTTTKSQQILVNDSHFDNKPIDMTLAALLGDPPGTTIETTSRPAVSQGFNQEIIDLTEAAERILNLPSVASKSFLITIADRSVTGLVARDQMIGPWQVPVADCAITSASFSSHTGEAFSVGERTPIASCNAPASGRMAVAEAITNIAAAPIENLSGICLSANWMAAAGDSVENLKLYETVQATAMELCPALGIAIPVGKDSMSMQTSWRKDESDEQVISPVSLIVTALAPVKDVRLGVTPQLRTSKGETCLLLVDLGHGKNRCGGSALAQVYSEAGGDSADLDKADDLKHFFQTLQLLRQKGQLLAYHDRSDGGLFVTLAEMSFAGHVGLDIYLDDLTHNTNLLPAALFNEEVGAVLQICTDELDEIIQLFADVGLDKCVHKIGKLNQSDQINFYYDKELVLSGSRVMFQRWWAQTSSKIQALRDNEEVVEQEFANLLDANDPGLQVQLSFEPDENICAPYINTNPKPKIAVLREQGVNGHVEMAAAFHRAEFTPVDIHMTDLLKGSVTLDQFQGLAACGGFSYSDVLGAGRGWAQTILRNNRAYDQFAKFFARPDSFTLGVCNGCQMLSHLKQLIPGSGLWPEFKTNLSEQFEARFSLVEVQPNHSIFLSGMQGSKLPVAVSHKEGQAKFQSEELYHQAQDKQLISLRFIDNYGSPTECYPFNPNGSIHGTTGLSSEDGRVTIMMPHPERVFRSIQNSWHPDSWQEDGPWLRMFRNARVWLD